MPPTLAERFGLVIQIQRQSEGLNQAQLAVLAELSQKYIGEVERAEANISMEALDRVCTALQWDPFEVPLREQDTLADAAARRVDARAASRPDGDRLGANA